MTSPPPRRRYELRHPEPLVVEFHEDGCDCPACYEVELTPDEEEALRVFCAAGWLAGLGILIGSAIAFAIDPAGAWLALTSALLGVR